MKTRVILSLVAAGMAFMPVARAQVAPHKAQQQAAAKQPTLREAYEFMEGHLNDPGMLKMAVEYRDAKGGHGSMTVSYVINNAAVSGCIAQYLIETNVVSSDNIPNNETLAIENDAEYKAYTQAVAVNDNDGKIAALKAFLEKYPQSAGRQNVLDELMRAYFAKDDRGAVGTAQQVLAANPLNFAALYITDHTPECEAETPEYLSHLLSCISRFKFSDVTEVASEPFGDYLKERHTALGLGGITATLEEPGTTAWILRFKDGRKAVIPVADAALAEKMTGMAKVAMARCGKPVK